MKWPGIDNTKKMRKASLLEGKKIYMYTYIYIYMHTHTPTHTPIVYTYLLKLLMIENLRAKFGKGFDYEIYRKFTRIIS